jgi:hypothetical protein
MNLRITPENLDILGPKDRVIVGTNESGLHGAGIALKAYKDWNLMPGQGFGPSGSCFGIPTKDWHVQTLPLFIIKQYIGRYINWVRKNPQYIHYVTKVGCGLAGYEIQDIAPMFEELKLFKNVWMPQEFRDFYEGKYKPEKDGKLTAKFGYYDFRKIEL